MSIRITFSHLGIPNADQLTDSNLIDCYKMFEHLM